MRLNPLCRASVVAFESFRSWLALCTPFVQTNLFQHSRACREHRSESHQSLGNFLQCHQPDLGIRPRRGSCDALQREWERGPASGEHSYHRPRTAPQGPTGQVFNSTASFLLTNGNGQKATFLFDTLGGSIVGWNGTTAVTQLTNAGASYTGLALGSSTVGDTLYAANFGQGKIDAISAGFSDENLAGSFVDPNLPACAILPTTSRTLGGSLYVEYALVNPTTGRVSVGAGEGLVDIFDANGNFVKRLINPGGSLDAPWGITLAPTLFPVFGGDLLVGNFGDGTIHAFDPTTGALLGSLTDSSNNPIANPGLWGIVGFRTASEVRSQRSLFHAAGINGEQDGLFGSISTAPEPGTLALMGIACGGLLLKKVIGRRQ